MAIPGDLFQFNLDRLVRLEAVLKPITLQQQDLSSHDLMRAIRGHLSDDDDYGLATAVLAVQGKAKRKLGEGFWWCDERSLAQSTPIAVAKRKSRWTGDGDVYDLCCGIGADAIALTTSSTKVVNLQAVDADALIAAMADRNLANGNGSRLDRNWTVLIGRAEDQLIADRSWVHLDPDRRRDGGRTTHVDYYSPTWGAVEKIAENACGGLVKIAPAASLEDRPERHRVWISLRGSVREQSVLFGESIAKASDDLEVSLAGGGRSAVTISEDGDAIVFHVSAKLLGSDTAPHVAQPLQFMIDPDAAIRAAGLTDAFAVAYDAKTLGGPTGFLTSDASIDTANAISKRILWSGSSDDRKLRRTLRQMNCYPQRVKTRGAAGDANTLERRYRNCGDKPVILWIGKSGRRKYAVISEV
ncbi:class I SAM-dependent methyltransferase [Roseiconus lacunae]|uniref:class I SAM-dependent methyltransferase n=1 Tax=Roseiconus lacunae TaxID=2605694 RepID=UPI001E457639|nr:class I SAM-dependent methyltransferase [Roseiconus lacunae]MCD0461289.1 class I SAM-dependent methyltransferase [Roseiconus lacunae]